MHGPYNPCDNHLNLSLLFDNRPLVESSDGQATEVATDAHTRVLIPIPYPDLSICGQLT
jgi:hypothetical protein